MKWKKLIFQEAVCFKYMMFQKSPNCGDSKKIRLGGGRNKLENWGLLWQEMLNED